VCHFSQYCAEFETKTLPHSSALCGYKEQLYFLFTTYMQPVNAPTYGIHSLKKPFYADATVYKTFGMSLVDFSQSSAFDVL